MGINYSRDPIKIDDNTGEIKITHCLVKGHSDSVFTKWTIRVYTENRPDAGTDPNIFIQVKGAGGWTDAIPLHNKAGQLEKGGTHEVIAFDIGKISMYIGQLEELSVWHDNSGASPDWFLDKIELLSETLPGGKVTFECGRWLALDSDNHKIHQILLPKEH